MKNIHEPSDQFIERLGRDLGAEVRRRNREAPAPPWWPALSLKAAAALAALVLVSMAVGGAVVAAAYQNENREQRAMLTSVYERKVQLEQVKLEAAKQQLKDSEFKVAAGILDQSAMFDARQGVVEAEAGVRIAQLNLEEVAATGREPRDEVSAPATPGRDFVRERLTVGISIAQGSLDNEKRRLQAAERRVRLGLAPAGEVDLIRGRILDLESAIVAAQSKIDARQLFLANKYDSELADLRVAQIDAELRYRRLMPQLDLAVREKERMESMVKKGLVSSVEVTKANVKVLELQIELQRAEVESSIAKQKIAERTASKTSGS